MKKYRFHNMYLSYNQQVAVTELAEANGSRAVDVIQSAAETSLKVSFSWDNFHSTCLMSITPKSIEHPFSGFIVSVRHDDVDTLVRILQWLEAEGWKLVDAPKGEDEAHSW